MTSVVGEYATGLYVPAKQIQISASGLRPDSDHSLKMSGILVGGIRTDGQGTYSGSFTIPSGTFQVGAHELLLISPDGESSATTSVRIGSNIVLQPQEPDIIDERPIETVIVDAPEVLAFPETTAVLIPYESSETQETALRATTIRVQTDSTQVKYLQSKGIVLSNARIVVTGPAGSSTITGFSGTASVLLPQTNNTFKIEFIANNGAVVDAIRSATEVSITATKAAPPAKPTGTPTPAVYLQAYTEAGIPTNVASGVNVAKLEVIGSTNTTASGTWSFSSSSGLVTVTNSGPIATVSYANAAANTLSFTLTGTYTIGGTPYTQTIGLTLKTEVAPIPVRRDPRTDYYYFLEY